MLKKIAFLFIFGAVCLQPLPVFADDSLSLGTTTPIGNSLLTIEATSSDSILATLRAFAGQVGNLLQVQDGGGTNLFTIDASGAAQFSNTLSAQNFAFLNASGASLALGGQLAFGSTATSSAFNLGSIVWNGTSFFGKTGTATTISTGWVNLAQDNTVDVFLIAGQSNAEGRGTASLSPVPQPGTVLQYYRGTISAGSDPVGGAITGSAWPAFGIAYYKATGHKVLFVPTAVGGTAQVAAADTGAGNWSSSGTLYDTSVSTLDAAVSAITAAGYTPSFKGVLWDQGEWDANAINSATITAGDYQAGLTAMIARYRARYGVSLPFYIFQTGTKIGVSDVGYAAVRNAQEYVASSDILTRVVFRSAIDFASLGQQADIYHYTQDGYNQMGTVGAANITSADALTFFQHQYNATTTGDIYFTKGNVGVGTTTTTQKLEVAGNINIPTGSCYMVNGTCISSGSSVGGSGTVNKLTKFIGTGTTIGDSSLFETGGRLGILTASPSYTLDVAGPGHFTGLVDASNFVATSTTATSTFAGGLAVKTSGLVYDSSTNNVGIGTASPTSKLHVIGNTNLSGNVAIGGTVIDPNIGLTTSLNVTNPTADQQGAFFSRTLVVTGTNAKNIYGGNFSANSSANNFNLTGSLNGGLFTAQNSNTATLTTAKGGSFLVYNVGAGTITTGAAGNFDIQNLNASGVITSAYGAKVNLPFNLGTLTNTYGVWVGDITTGTQTNTPYSFYASDVNAYNYFAGRVGVGTSAPVAKLDVNGVVKVGSASAPKGITLYDDTNGTAYCVTMHAGALVSSAGTCAN